MNSFQCPATGEKLNTACGLNECRYHVEFKYNNNCLLSYLNSHGTDQLSAEEIAYLYNVPLATVQKEIDNGFSLLRKEAFLAEAVQDPDMEKQFSFIATDKICCVCGSSTNPQTKLNVKDTPLAYCSTECSEDEPQGMIQLEYRLGLPAAKILRWAFMRFKTLIVVEKALGINRHVLDILCKKILNKNLKDVVANLK